MRCLFALLCMVACACAAGNFKDCGSVLATVKALKVDGKDKCEVQKDSTSTVKIDYEMKETVDGKVRILASAIGGSVLFNVKDGCKSGDLKCPLEKGKSYTFEKSVKVPNVDTEEDVDVTWRFITKDKEGKKVFAICIEVPCKVT